MPVRDIQPIQQLIVCQLLWDDVGLEDDVVHFLPVFGLLPQNCDCLVDPIHQQTGLFHTFQPMLQPIILHGQLCIDSSE